MSSWVTVVALVLLAESNFSAVAGQCLTKNQNGESKPCKFPFILDSEVYFGCTTDQDPALKLWCSTQTWANHTHTGGGGHWGYCDESNSECLIDANFHSLNRKALVALSSLQDLEMFNERSEASANCPCKSLKDCEPASNLNSLLKEVSRAHPVYEQGISFLRNQVCNRESRTIKCCNSQPQLIVEKSETELKTPIQASNERTESELIDRTNSSLGSWIPRQNDCGYSLTTTHILGGEATKPGEMPFMALLGYKIKESDPDIYYICGGTVLNKWYILTAAHCIISKYALT